MRAAYRAIPAQTSRNLRISARQGRIHMQMLGLTTAPAKAPVYIEALKTIAMFCGVGLTVWLLLASYGLDLSAGFF
jgi:hypothetical protein